ncbi:MAG: hypothetical protein EPN47_09730 [Acidobacteria bacterium]|nr:MAG: hypothetical protein EPN47_09730 [Acidobacteriota bacterium]
MAVNLLNETGPAVEKGQDYYRFVWSQIKRLAPDAALLRGPDFLNPLQTSSSADLDVLITKDSGLVKAFLNDEGFYRVFKPHAYLERFRFQLLGTPDPYTIDLYSAERWGPGFRLPVGQVPLEARTACLLHAVVDRKGTKCFEQKAGGPPWRNRRIGDPKFGPLGRALWRKGSTRLLTLYLLLKGVIVADLRMIFRTQYRRVAYRIWQVMRKTGLEVALLGVDGAGKSSVAGALRNLPAPVKVIYMGPHNYQTRIMRFVDRHRKPLLVWQLGFRYDLFMRRVYGWLFARRGWIVVYDRHPAERLDPRQRSLRNRAKDFIDCLYAWPVDLTFWLTGDYSALYMRKMEYLPEELRTIDQRFQAILTCYHIPFERVDVTKNDLDSVGSSIGKTILAKHQERISVGNLPGLIKAALM